MHTVKNPETASGNLDSGSEVAQKLSCATSPEPAGTAGAGLSATPSAPVARPRADVGDLKYWRKRLFTRSYDYQGTERKLPELNVRIQFAGKRSFFNLASDNKDVAAQKAREIFKHLEKHGWPATLEKYSPRATKIEKSATLGQFLAEVERTAGLKPRTFHRYAQYLRMIAAHINGVQDKDGQRYNYRTGGREAWLAKVDSMPLVKLTPAAAEDWKAAYLAGADNDPLCKIRKIRSFNTALRSAKSLFADSILHKPNFRVHAPKFRVQDSQKGGREVLWFDTLNFEKAGSFKFSPPDGVTFETLIVAARRELRAEHPDAYLLLLLCLGAGLRRTEADCLLWNQIHYGPKAADCFITIEANEYVQPKHDSGGLVYVEPELAKEILSFKAQASTAFVVKSPQEWKRAATYHRYRCEPHWATLNTWLGKKGISDRKRIHTLRKLFGDALTKRSGIYAAAAQLRHSSVQMTERHYSDPRQRAPLPVAGLLSDTPLRAVPPDAKEVAKLVRKIKALSPEGRAQIAALLQSEAAIAA